MRSRNRVAAATAALACAAAVAACGSQTTRTVTATVTHTVAAAHVSTSTTSTTGAVAHSADPGTQGRLPGTPGRPATPASLDRFVGRPPLSPGARLAGVQNMSLDQEQAALLQNVAQFWAAWFHNEGQALPAGGYSLVTGTTSCGSAQITATSGPAYCPSNSIIYLPQTTMARQIKPLGDSALLYVLAYLYAQHVGDAVGVTTAKYGSTKLPQIYSCFAGVYFQQAEGEGYLQPTDESGVNRILLAIAPNGSKVTSAELTQAFNQGILSKFHTAVCLH
jgi:hypothetical protein